MTPEEIRKRRREWTKAYYHDPAHPERLERRRASSREYQRRQFLKTGRWGDRFALPDGMLRQTQHDLDELAELMKGRKYG